MAKVDIQVVAQTERLKKSVKEVSSVMRTMTGTVNKNAGAYNKAQQEIRSMNNSLTNLNKDANRSNAIFGKLGGTLKMMVGAGALLGLGRQLGFFVKSATAMIETNNLFAVSMGKSTESANQFVLAMSEAVGLDATNMRNAIGTFGLLARSMGINNENAETLSTTMYQLGLDLSSLTNVDINQVMGDLRSGLLGQSETVYKYGIDVTEASLKTEALAQGITKSVRNMGQGEKMALRYAVMLKQTTLAQGDFARTLETPANQMRVLKERFITLSRTIGTIFIPILGATLPYANAIVKVLNELFMALARLVGYKDAPIEGIETGTGGTATNLEDAVGSAKQLKQVMSGIDELNVISEQSIGGSEGIGVDLGDPNAFQFNTYDALLAGIKTKSDEVADSIRKVFSAIGEKLEPLLEPLTKLGNLGQSGFTWLWENVLIPFGSWTWNELLPKAIETIVAGLTELGKFLDSENFKMAIGWMYKYVLKPSAELIGTGIIGAIDLISEVLINFMKFLRSDELKTAVGWLYDWVLKPVSSLLGQTLKLALKDLIDTSVDMVKYLLSDDFKDAVGYLYDTILEPTSDTLGLIIKGSLDTIIETLGYLQEKNTDVADEWEKNDLRIKNSINDELVPALKTMGKNYDDLMSKSINPFFKSFFELSKEMLKNVVELGGSIKDKYVDAWKMQLDILSPFLATTMTFIGGLFTTLTQTVVGTAQGVVQSFDGILKFLRGTFKMDFELAMIGISLVAQGVGNIFISLFEGVVNSMIDMMGGFINLLIDIMNTPIKLLNQWLSNMPDVLQEFLGLGSVPQIGLIPNIPVELGRLYLPRIDSATKEFAKYMARQNAPNLGGNTLKDVRLYANGGFPDQGELFIAREAGAEMVGSIGGRSAVVNNEQIVEAVAQGVARAVAGVMQGGGQVIENVINIDGEVLYKNQQEVSRKRGIDFGMGVFAR